MTNATLRHQTGCRAFTLTELLACVALACLLLGGILPLAMRKAEMTSGRVRCQSNLRQIGLALQMYANENRGNFPRTRFDVGNPDPMPTAYSGASARNPFEPSGPALNDVTAGLFLLLRTQDLTSEVFLCDDDASGAERWGGNPLSASNFPGRQNLSYSYQNPYPGAAAVKRGFKLNFTLTSDFAVASDMNPGGAALLNATPAMTAEQLKSVNSNNKFGWGQNVLYADGHVELQNTPFCGMQRVGGQRDNIFTAGGPNPNDLTVSAAQRVNAAPADELDSVLLPIAPEGPMHPVPPPRPSVVQLPLFWLCLAAVGMVIAIARMTVSAIRSSKVRVTQT